MLLKTQGPQTAADLGVGLGITGEAARQQLLKLAGDGLVEAMVEVRGVGRPSQVWRLTASGNTRFPDTHAELTVQLIHTVKTVLGEEALERLITAREQETRAAYTPPWEEPSISGSVSHVYRRSATVRGTWPSGESRVTATC